RAVLLRGVRLLLVQHNEISKDGHRTPPMARWGLGTSSQPRRRRLRVRVAPGYLPHTGRFRSQRWEMDLLERGPQLSAVEHALTAAAHGDGSLLVVRGAAGTGKSALLDAASELAAGRGFGVLTACGGELETGFAFGAARQLFERR